ncbi:SRPBCC family protein [Archangium lansingense]|uniref:SRPBCC family protein n=1 Tax=Archangium lansingense TaxID=2995310 RepID=UPI003B7FA17C
MKEYKASTTIHAPPEKIWTILTDGASWPQWDPSCEKLEGRIAPGEKLKAFTKLSPGRAFPVKVSEFVPNQKMTWSGGMPLGLFKGVRTFTLTPKGDKVEFTLHEVFSGPMLALIGGSIPDMSDAFQKFVEGLKRRAEA